MALQEGVNSNVTLAYADAYFADRLHSDVWDALTDDVKSKALITATLRLESEEYEGKRVSSTQALSFPRTYLPLVDDVSYNGTTPWQVKNATCELAQYMSTKDTSDPEATRLLDTIKVGSISLDYGGDKQSSRSLPPFVLSMLKPFLTTSGGQPMLYRG